MPHMDSATTCIPSIWSAFIIVTVTGHCPESRAMSSGISPQQNPVDRDTHVSQAATEVFLRKPGKFAAAACVQARYPSWHSLTAGSQPCQIADAVELKSLPTE